MKKKGFTLIEVIIVAAIVGVLAAILIPAMMAYITKSKKTATVANGKELWTMCYGLISEDDDARQSFYTPIGKSWTFFEGTPDGHAVMDYTYYNGERYLHSKKITNKNARVSADGNYLFTVVARVDGADHPYGGDTGDPRNITNLFNTWNYSDARYDDFISKLSKLMDLKPKLKGGTQFPLKMPYTDRDDGCMHDVVRWLLCYRVNDRDKIEIWAGDGYKAENGPVYRVYPDPCPIYGVSG